MGRSTSIWMPIYISDWDGDTAHLTCEQDGAYGRLVRYYWRCGPPPDDDVALASIVRMSQNRWKKVRPIVSTFFIILEGRWTHRRVDEEIGIAEKNAEVSRINGRKGGRPPKNPAGNLDETQQGTQSKTPARVKVDVLEASGDEAEIVGLSKKRADAGDDPLSGGAAKVVRLKP